MLKKAAKKVVKAAKDHHNSVNAAFDAVYGAKYYSAGKKGGSAVWV